VGGMEFIAIIILGVSICNYLKMMASQVGDGFHSIPSESLLLWYQKGVKAVAGWESPI
jgi:hypothetical protein